MIESSIATEDHFLKRLNLNELEKLVPTERFLFASARLARGGLVVSLLLLIVLGFISR